MGRLSLLVSLLFFCNLSNFSFDGFIAEACPGPAFEDPSSKNALNETEISYASYRSILAKQDQHSVEKFGKKYELLLPSTSVYENSDKLFKYISDVKTIRRLTDYGEDFWKRLRRRMIYSQATEGMFRDYFLRLLLRRSDGSDYVTARIVNLRAVLERAEASFKSLTPRLNEDSYADLVQAYRTFKFAYQNNPDPKIFGLDGGTDGKEILDTVIAYTSEFETTIRIVMQSDRDDSPYADLSRALPSWPAAMILYTFLDPHF